jgi:hypothetical protein
MLELIDNIYILKLKKNDTNELEKNIKSIFPNKNYELFEVDGNTTNRNEGSINLSLWKILNHNFVDDVAKDITKNHIAMIRQAYMANYNYVLFLEEDARIENINKKKWDRVNKWLSTKNKWDIFYFGYCNWPILFSFFITRDIIRLYSPLAAHSYILNRRGMQKILNYTENGNKNMNIHIDKMFSILPNFHKYAIFPMISFQSKDPALYTKACDKMNINISMKTLCKTIQYLSLFLPILFIILLSWILIRLFWKK